MSKKIGLMFAGQGAQNVGMGKDFYETSAAAKEIFECADDILGRSISKLCFEGPIETLTLSQNCQPAIYTMSVACFKALEEKSGIVPAITAGLSLGEFAALTAAGKLPFEDGIQLVAKRGELMASACRNSNGTMAAVLNADLELLEELCAKYDVDVANYNCPGQTVISGGKDKIPATIEALTEAGVKRIIPLTVDGAFHSRLMQPAADSFTEVLANTKFLDSSCPVCQNFTGKIVTGSEDIRINLAQQVSGSVRWESCVNSMLDYDCEALIELGPGKVLSGFMRRINRKFPTYNVSSNEELIKVLDKLN